MLLADIAHIGGARDRELLRLDRGAGDGVASLCFDLAIDAVDVVERRAFKPRKPASHIVVTQVREQHTECREYAWGARDDHTADAKLARDRGRVQRPRTAIGYEREIAD